MGIDFNALVLTPCIATFGEVNQGFPIVQYNPKKGGSFTVDGVFDESYKEITIKDGEAYTTLMPVLGAKVSDFPIPPLQNDMLIARGQTYIVREVRYDGHGNVKLMLNLVEKYESS